MLHPLSPVSLLLAACAAAEPAPAQSPPTTATATDAAATFAGDPSAFELLPHAGVLAECERLAALHPGVARAFDYGVSGEGRPLRALELAAPGAPADRPALLVVANLDGARVFDSALALEHARRLAGGYGSDAAATALLDAWRVLVVPRANPDAAEQHFAAPRHDLGLTGRGVDDDRDARDGEDPPADVDGDGLVTWMRVPDPEGRMQADPHDPRATVEADRLLGQRGGWRLEREGFDADGDEHAAEDPVHDARVDANFPAGFAEHTAAAGRFPLSEPEARALVDLVLARADVAAVVVYGEASVLAKEPKGAPEGRGRIPAAGPTEADAKVLGALGKRYRDAVESPTEGAGSDAGSFARWAYEHRGLWTLTATPWRLPDGSDEKKEKDKDEDAPAPEPGGAAAAEPPPAEPPPAEAADAAPAADAGAPPKPPGEPSAEAKRLAWIDARGADEAWRFVPWRAFAHPQLGDVEVGGLAPHALVLPPRPDWAGIADAHHAFLLALADAPARVALEGATATRLADGLWKVEVAVVNAGYLPLSSEAARRARTPLPARVELALPEGAAIVAGPVRVLVEELEGAGGRRELEWLVRARDAAGLAVGVTTTYAGSDRAEVEVR